MKSLIVCVLKRSTIILVLIFSHAFHLEAQTTADGSRPQFLFPEFVQGKVRMRNGLSQSLKLNYNTVSEKMVYEKEGLLYDIVNVWMIDAVIIQNTMFVSVGTVFHQLLFIGPMPLLAYYRGEIIPSGTIVGYGGTSQVSNAKSITSLKLGIGDYNDRLPPDYIVKNEKVYVVKRDGKFQNFVNEKQFLKIFPYKELELKKFIRQNRIRFDNDSDLIQLVEFCNSHYPPGIRLTHSNING